MDHAQEGEIRPGIVVEKIAAHSEAEKAGLQEGDILLVWSRGDSKGEIQSPFDLMDVETEQGRLGGVKLAGLRGTGRQSWSLGPTSWGLTARPNFSEPLLSSYLQGQELANRGKAAEIIEATKLWKELVKESAGATAPWLATWLFFHNAEVLRDAKLWKEADETYQAAVQSASAASAFVGAQVLQAWANAYQQRDDWVNAEKYLQQSMMRVQSTDRDRLFIAADLNTLGTISWQSGDLAKAEQYYSQALEIRKRLAPGTILLAGSVNNMGIVAWIRGDLDKADQYYRQALAIHRKLAPQSLWVAQTLDNLGVVAFQRGNLDNADQYYRQALEIEEKLAPASHYVAEILNNLALVAYQRGDLDKADQYYHQSLEIEEKLAPGSLALAKTLNNFGLVANKRGDLDKADQYHHQALEIEERLAPGSLVLAACLGSLGNVARERGDLDKAYQYYHQALEIQEKLAPGSLDVAATLDDLGLVAKKRGDLAKAEQYLRQAVIISEKVAPGSIGTAEFLADLATVLRDGQQPDVAAQFYARAVSALESQSARLGGSEEVRSGFRANHSDIYRSYIDLLLVQREPERAFEMLERSRARILLETLLAAHVDIRKGADPTLLEQERSLQELLTAKKDRRLRLIGDKNNAKQVAAFTQEIEDLERRYQEVEERLRLNSPDYSALTQPQPLTANEIQQLLDSGTLLIEYSLGDERSYVFAVTTDSLTVHELPERAEIESHARHLYELLTARNRFVKSESADARQRRIVKSDAEHVKAASTLSRILLNPVAADWGRKRLVIVADGALQYIPFAALPVPQTTHVPLIAEHEIVELPTASVLALLRREHVSHEHVAKQVVVIADPVFDARDIRVRHTSDEGGVAGVTPAAANDDLARESGSTRQLTRSLADVDPTRDGSFHLPRLLFTRREATAIVALAPAGTARAAIDFDANRKLAISGELARYRIVHFATHALVDNQHPELSGLVLSLVDEHGKPQNGFLDLQDIYNLDLAADLVVLSACDTALGKQVESEGMIGLTRGFMYAGASRVVASLWNVDDVVTAELMRRFYSAMEKDGIRPAQALRQAQIEIGKQQHWSHPYYWAAFQLQGEWK